jgi:hypothetical protein
MGIKAYEIGIDDDIKPVFEEQYFIGDRYA